MRIVQLANFHCPTSGGLRVAVDTLRAGYRQAGHDCTLVAPGRVDGRDGSIRTLRSPKLPNRSGHRVILRRRAVLALLDELRPDIIEVHDKLLQQWVWTWSRARRVPLVAVSHERLASSMPMLLPFAPDSMVRSATQVVARRTVSHCDALVTCSRFAAAEFGIDPRLHVVPLGVDLTAFRPGPAVVGRGPLRLIAVGRLSAEKRPDLAIETLRALHWQGVESQLSVLGTGPLLGDLQQLADGLPVTFRGFLADRAEVAEAIGRADIAIVPGPVETFGLAALEALACGTPVVVAAGAAPSELVADHPMAGRATTTGATEFADAVRQLLALHPRLRRAAARRCAEAYPWSATVTTMLDLHARTTTRLRLDRLPSAG